MENGTDLTARVAALENASAVANAGLSPFPPPLGGAFEAFKPTDDTQLILKHVHRLEDRVEHLHKHAHGVHRDEPWSPGLGTFLLVGLGVYLTVRGGMYLYALASEA